MRSAGVCFLSLFLCSWAIGACGTESPQTRCYLDRECPDGQVCLGGTCVVRLDGSVPQDASEELVPDTAEDAPADRDLALDPVDLVPDRPVQDVAPDRDAPVDVEVAEDTGVDPDGPPPCDDTPEICDGLDNDCDGWIDEEGVCDDLDVGIRVELSWDAQPADVDLHFLNRNGVLGSQTVDPNDCYYNNPNPEWGNPMSASDNPLYAADIHQGGSMPEVVTLKQPPDEPFRILVYYAVRGSWQTTPVSAEVRVFFDGELEQTFSVGAEQFPDVGYYWNVACVNYRTGSVRPLGEITLRPERPEPFACGGNDCESLCDCAQGLACSDGLCAEEATGAYCCDNSGCPLGTTCHFADGSAGLCGGWIDFDSDLDGDPLAQDVDVEELYTPAGVHFSTDRENATVMTNPFELRSRSGGNSCATRDDGATGEDPVYWLGNVRITFTMPGTADYPAATRSVSLYLGQTWPGGLTVEYYSPEGDLLTSRTTDSMGTDLIQLQSEDPIGSLNIRPAEGPLSDPDLTLDDLVYGPLFLP